MATEGLPKLIQDVVRKDPSRLNMLASFAGKRCPTLMREADPNDKRAKLGVDTLLAIMKASGDVSPLAYMAHQMGLELVKISKSPEMVTSGENGRI